jgi:AcrR family transcriptional regulator
MSVTERAVARSVAPRQQRAEDEVRTLVEAGLAVLRRRGTSGLTVSEVLAEAGLSTRAFYRHFQSKDELLLAVYERESERRNAELRARLERAPSPAEAVEVWVDEMLALAFDRRRAPRTRVLLREGARSQADFPSEFAVIVAGTVEPLEDALRALPSPDPARDAWSIYAVTWELVQQKLRGARITRDAARAHVLRFCGPGIGLTP